MNRVCLVARLTRDPELRDASGTPVVGMRVAWNTRRKSEEKSNFISVTAFGKTAELCAQYLTKGREVAIDGRLELDEWESDGQKRSEHKIIADNVRFLGGKDGAAAPSSDGGDFPSDDDSIPF